MGVRHPTPRKGGLPFRGAACCLVALLLLACDGPGGEGDDGAAPAAPGGMASGPTNGASGDTSGGAPVRSQRNSAPRAAPGGDDPALAADRPAAGPRTDAPLAPPAAGPLADVPLAAPAVRGAGSPPRARTADELREGALPWAEPTSCAPCHEQQSLLHARSDHGRAMQRASDASVLGDFAGAELEHDGVTSRFFRDGDRFMVRTTGADGAPADFELAYTFGVRPLQQYLVAVDGGRLQALDLAWDTTALRWFVLPLEPPPPGDAFHWTGPFQTANAMCIECHVTAFEPGYDAADDSWSSTWLETGVGCQACHGPGRAHLAWADAGEPESDATMGLLLDPNGPGQVELCAGCHARRRAVSVAPEPGEPLLDRYAPALLRAGLYHADGQILDEVFVYGSFAQSRMHALGVRCGDCHDPHSLELRARGDTVCTQCHNPHRADPRFPTLKVAAYDGRAHHRHEPGTAGSACVDCHMPARTYMRVDPRRDHGIRVPRPDLAARLGTPDACTGCHTDHEPPWAADLLRTWAAEDGRQTRLDQPHYAEGLAAARAGHASVAALAALAADDTQPPIVRATAVEHLGELAESGVQRDPAELAGAGGAGVAVAAAGNANTAGAPPTVAGALALAARDAEPLVRLAAAGVVTGLDPATSRALALELLGDPVRAVRVEAARWLGALADARSGLADSERRVVASAVTELVAVEQSLSALPDAPFRLALLASQLGDATAAEAGYRRALWIDPGFLPARFNLVHLLDGTGRAAEAEAVLREGLTLTPADGELHYSLGLLLAQLGRLAEAETHLGRASALLPDRSRVAYNHGLALRGLGRLAEAEQVLLEALARDPREADALSLLLGMALDRRDADLALARARALAELWPGSPELEALIHDLQSPATGR